jgi:hypothetical protein
MLTRDTAAALVAVLGVVGLMTLTGISFFLPELDSERKLLVGALIALTSGAGVWVFKNQPPKYS